MNVNLAVGTMTVGFLDYRLKGLTSESATLPPDVAGRIAVSTWRGATNVTSGR